VLPTYHKSAIPDACGGVKVLNMTNNINIIVYIYSDVPINFVESVLRRRIFEYEYFYNLNGDNDCEIG
jgi:hypothetical protein